MLRKPEVKDQYDQVIEEYLTLGHMSRIEHDSVCSPKPSYYLPHHAVFKPDSMTNKLFVVFNAAPLLLQQCLAHWPDFKIRFDYFDSLTRTYKRCIDKYWSYQITPLSRGYYSGETPRKMSKISN